MNNPQRLEGFYAYNGFNAPEYLGATLAEVIAGTNVSHDHAAGSADVTLQAFADISEEAQALGIDGSKPLRPSEAEDLAGVLYNYGMWALPSRQDFEDFNRSKGLEPDAYISDLFEGGAEH